MTNLHKTLQATPSHLRLPLLMQAADEEREAIFVDMDEIGNILICGNTGSGKSTLMHSMISSLIYAKSPKDFKLAILDGKGIEHGIYVDLYDTFLIGHPSTGSVDNEKRREILDVIEWISQEVSRRLKLVKDAGVDNVLELNKKNSNAPLLQLPDIVVFIDNCDELFGDCFVNAITIISQFGNITGVHFVCVTDTNDTSLLQFLQVNADANILFHIPDVKTLQMLSRGRNMKNPKGIGFYKIESSRTSETQILYIDEIDKDFDVPDLVEIASQLELSETLREKLDNNETEEIIDNKVILSDDATLIEKESNNDVIDSSENSEDINCVDEEPMHYNVKFNWGEWDLYKRSIYGKTRIEQFRALLAEKLDFEEVLEIAKDIDDSFFRNSGEQTDRWFIDMLDVFEAKADYVYGEMLKESGDEGVDPLDFVYTLFFILLTDSNENINNLNEIPQARFKWLLQNLMPLSFALFNKMPDDYLPNLYILQFEKLIKVSNLCGIELPDIPKKPNYRERCIYYVQMSFLLNAFAGNNEIYDPAEVCAFFFDFVPSLDVEQNEEEDNFFGRSAWLLVGNRIEGEIDMDYGLWQANSMTKKGDILFFYEKSPVKAMNAIWICRKGGIKDPFFWGYSYAYIGKCHENGDDSNGYIEIPKEQWITFDDFKNSEYFKTRSSKGNFVSKNFQDTSGWEINRDDFDEIIRLFGEKGFDVSLIPEID